MSNHLKDLPAGYILCPTCKHASRGICPRCNASAIKWPLVILPPGVDPAPASKLREGGKKRKGGPNKTEVEYRRKFIDRRLAYSVVLYEPFRLNLAAGYGYTPDFVVMSADRRIIEEIHEAKGPWQSRDAHIRWAQAAQEWPSIRFYWGKKDKNGEWKMEERNT